MNVVRQLVLDELPRRVRQQNLTAVARRTNARATVDAHPDISFATDERLTSVDPHPHTDGDTVGPGLRGEPALRGYSGANRVARAREGDEERITLRIDLVATEPFNCRTEQPGVRRKNLVVPVAKLLQQPRRPFDVTEEEGDGAGRTLGQLDDCR